MRRAIGACVRAIAGDGELDVSPFSKDKPGLMLAGSLPEFWGVFITEGSGGDARIGDPMALRHAKTDALLHGRFAPEGEQARAVYDAVEQARINLLGALSNVWHGR